MAGWYVDLINLQIDILNLLMHLGLCLVIAQWKIRRKR